MNRSIQKKGCEYNFGIDLFINHKYGSFTVNEPIIR
jgi:hypothetical protein